AAIETFGTNNKIVLLASVTLGALALGAALGPLAGHDRRIGYVALAGFGLLGALAAARAPLTIAGLAFVNAAAAAGLAAWVLTRLLDAATPAVSGAPSTVTMPGPGVADRRRFFTLATGTASAAAL